MNALITFLCLLFFALALKAQEKDSVFFFRGVVLDPNSIPVENAYLINYRTIRAYATNAEGKFYIPVLEGDSLKITHISYEAQIIKPTRKSQIIKLDFEENSIEMVTLKYHNRDLENLKNNWNNTMFQFKNEHYYNYSHDFVRNPYAATKGQSATVAINIFELIDRIKRARKKK